MKAITLMALLMFSNLAFTNTVTCVDDKKIWNVSFELSEEVVKNLLFLKNGKVYREFAELDISIVRIRVPFSNRGVIFYEMNFGGSKYFDFERTFVGDDIQTNFPAAFVLSSNPFSLEKHVDCTLK